MDSDEREGAAQTLMKMRESPTIGNRLPTVCSKNPNYTRRPLFPSGKHRGRCSNKDNRINHIDNNQNEDDTTSIDESISPINTRINTRSNMRNNMRNNTNSSIPISKNSKKEKKIDKKIEKKSKTKYEKKLKKIERIKNTIKMIELMKKEIEIKQINCQKNIKYWKFKLNKLISNSKN